MKKSKHLTVAEETSRLAKIAEASYTAGGMGDDEFECIKKRVQDVQMSNLFSAMAAFCDK